jgi:hypothetical protein
MQIVDHPDFSQPEDHDAPLWRYMDLARFVSLVSKQALFFPKAARLGDPLEGSYPRGNAALRSSYSERDNRLLLQRRTAMVEETLVSCWHMNRGESAAMWAIYVREQRGIALRTTFADLIRSFNSDPRRPDKRTAHAGLVRYIDFETASFDETNHLKPFIHKRLSYEYEHEVRIVIPSGQNVGRPFRKPWSPSGEYFEVDLATLIHAVHVDPKSSYWYRDAVQAVIDRFDLDTKVRRSDLHRERFI